MERGDASDRIARGLSVVLAVLFLFTGVAKLLGRFPIVKVELIEIAECPCRQEHCQKVNVTINGETLSHDEREKLARLDGFKDFTEMKVFWKGRLPFKGQIIHWNPFKQ